MNLPYELLIGWRYTRSSRRASCNTFISFISMISMAGIALGVAALIVVISVMNGFQKEVRDRMLAVLSHIEIISDIPMPDWGQVAQYAMKNPAVHGAAPFVAVQAMLTRDDTVRGVILRGVDPGQEGKVSDLSRQFRLGGIAALRPGEFGIALGVELARALDAHVGERVNLLVPQGTMTPAGIMPRLRAFTVTGIFESGHFEYDSALALIHIEDAEKLLRLEGPSGLRLRVADPTIAPHVTRELAPGLGSNFYLRDWSSQNRTWFAAVQTEKRMMFIILTLIIAVAAFNLVSTLVMTVTEKQADIAILRTMGAQPGAILRIFIVQGVSIGVIGTVCGVALGCLVAANIDVIVPAIEALFHVQFLPRDVYFIDELPSDLRSGDVTVIASIAFVMAILATLYPSWRAARVKPAEALRYE
ncbi:MAG: lipoprotein-releasing ABC transporter permease subunit [Candidatus Protistobacter heckmanni]|nr:lipoprotein-releasing ABC transporter permease subunit [Candidatus Protistobacter heckmanni]